ncbi:esterase-like activity of phytase family protein [Pseudooceanicola nanhaiensis]|uniref:esterase-like activity of phytase family protein n=1 Tax=Pseudooceanicola nanhaiensis TaxID=375761 RepID=UPI001CD7D824|nr:esterase-like activity of phytase family protein [Pseudooceanicola nanhaiensis]MCA0921254.1 esterase-like activity of phytase family protein [Pseudooceanicola nanhaiensis]
MRGKVPNLGGFSGLEVTAGGTLFVAISDRGYMFTGRLDRDSDGRLTAARALTMDPLLDPEGAPLTRKNFDAEGLAMTPEGKIAVSFEQLPRVWIYDAPGSTPISLTKRGDFPPLPYNGALESVAVDAEGRVFTLPEDHLTDTGRIPVWSLRNGRWEEVATLPFLNDGFLPAEAAIGPDGKFYLLERGFSRLSFRTRVRRFDLALPGDHGAETLLETAPGAHDNLEGLSVWRDGEGRLRLTMVADDNYLWVQRSEVVEYLLPDPAPLASKEKTP